MPIPASTTPDPTLSSHCPFSPQQSTQGCCQRRFGAGGFWFSPWMVDLAQVWPRSGQGQPSLCCWTFLWVVGCDPIPWEGCHPAVSPQQECPRESPRAKEPCGNQGFISFLSEAAPTCKSIPFYPCLGCSTVRLRFFPSFASCSWWSWFVSVLKTSPAGRKKENFLRESPPL